MFYIKGAVGRIRPQVYLLGFLAYKRIGVAFESPPDPHVCWHVRRCDGLLGLFEKRRYGFTWQVVYKVTYESSSPSPSIGTRLKVLTYLIFSK